MYLSDMAYANNSTSSMWKKIQAIMDNDLLDNCHPAILNVMFIDGTTTLTKEVTVDDEDVERIGPIQNRSMWMFAAIGILAMITLGVGTRYRYASQFKDDGSGDLKDGYDSEENFVEVESRQYPVSERTNSVFTAPYTGGRLSRLTER